MLNDLIIAIVNWFKSARAQNQPVPMVKPLTIIQESMQKTPLVSAATNKPSPVDTPKDLTPMYLFDSQQNARHSVRVICDEMGLNLYEKEVMCACIEQESQFYNYLPSGKPTIHKNPMSTDWGICQINDTPHWYIGPSPLPFPSVDFLMANPDKAVRFMIKMAIGGQLKKWVSYSSGEYLKHMPARNFTIKGRF